MAAKIDNKILQLNMLDQELKKLEQGAMEIEKHLYELQLTQNALEDLRSKGNSEVMIPLAGGIFVKGKIEDASKVLVHVGNKILAKKSIGDAKKILEKQMDKMMDNKKIVEEDLNSIVREMTALEEQVRKSQGSHSHAHKCECSDEECKDDCDDKECDCGHRH